MKRLGYKLSKFTEKELEDPRKKAWMNSGASEFCRIKKLILLIEHKQDYLKMLQKKEQTPLNADEIFRAKMKCNMEIRVLEDDLINQAKNKFRYIRGHDKAEVRPGIMLQEEKFQKNITKRIIKPSERVAHCQRTARGLHESAQKFSKYLGMMRKESALNRASFSSAR